MNVWAAFGVGLLTGVVGSLVLLAWPIVNGLSGIINRQEDIMATLDDVLAGIQATQAGIDKVAASTDAEIARIETLIAALQAPHDDPRVQQAVDALNAEKAALEAIQAKLDAERPA